MRVLAIDTSNLVLSVAVVDEKRVLGEITTNLQK
ncbi:MAG TPA: tRNA (adenosine(37)-N6)-threonylcarbamoyltransferase complex dimerization subunit type 1 TsaB, partial [Candidatus Bathyarchaeia archaeon]|nr:tRNA (adenosine(37)-N6)-threonylcarbamoyltransferase complex dimerization subunit type 1 TsaB [Candidatus Bathyarchaeia archaeon]